MIIVQIRETLRFFLSAPHDLLNRAADGQVVSCFAGTQCAGERTNGSFSFDDCCLSLGSQSFLTSSSDCGDCTGRYTWNYNSPFHIQ